jgi:hypothetical protein
VDYEAVAEHQRRIAAFDELLERVLAARDERATGPIPFSRSPQAIRVGNDDIVYRLTIERSPNFSATTNELPFPHKSDLLFGTGPRFNHNDALPLEWQAGVSRTDRRPPYARLRGAGVADGRYYVDVAFPRGIDESSIPTAGFLAPDRPRPAERTLQDEVRRWTRASNRFSPVLAAIVSPQPTTLSADPPRLENPGISHNPGQLAAVRLGLADVPLGLIKGPPGTGKTTVIVELILQAARRGQKVLLCSQTHQAVRNVLERLDGRGDVRMYRYGRDEKLSDLEKRYARGGSAAADTQGTLRRARERALAEKQAYETEAADVIAYQGAVEALARLDQLVGMRKRDLEESAAREEAARDAAAAQRREAEEQAAQAAVRSRADIDSNDGAVQTEKVAAERGLELLARRAARLGAISQSDGHPEPLDIHAPNHLRRQRLRLCLAALRQHEERHSAITHVHGQTCETISRASEALTARRDRAQSELAAAMSESSARCARETQQADQKKAASITDSNRSHDAARRQLESEAKPRLQLANKELEALTHQRDRLERTVRSLDEKLTATATRFRVAAGREPRRDAARRGVLSRWFNGSSTEVLEGEWAHTASLHEFNDSQFKQACRLRDNAATTHASLQATLAAALSRIASDHTSAVESAEREWTAITTASHAEHAERTAHSRRICETESANAEREYAEAVGDAPQEAERTRRLLEDERELIGWWTVWRDVLVKLGASPDAAGAGLDAQLADRRIAAFDDRCEPDEATARITEIETVASILRGVASSAEAARQANSRRRDEADATLAQARVQAEQNLASSIVAIEAERVRRDAAIEERITAERTGCASRIETAVHMATARRISASSTDTAQAWRARIDAREPVVKPLRERMEFTRAWVADLTKTTGVVEKLHWRHIDVFLATCVGISAWKELNQDAPDAVDLVIIDEAAHATLPEVLPPMRFGRRVLLIGDEMQLPPINDGGTRRFQPDGDWLPEDRMDPPPKSALVEMSDDWMERSLFEWLYLRRQGVPRVMLDRQFRMHPHIGGFISEVFYEGNLSDGVTADDRRLTFGDFQSAVCVVSTSQYPGRHERPGGGGPGSGYVNETEVRLVEKVLRQAAAGLSKPASFGIITPYAAQKRLLEQRVAALMPDCPQVKLDPREDIGSVDSYQGSERDCIIVSLVRSPADCRVCRGRKNLDGRPCRECRGRGFVGTGLSFARDLRRLNVAFSRARCSLIVVGDFDRLCDTSIRGGEEGGRILKLFADHVLRKGGTVQHVWEGGDGT